MLLTMSWVSTPPADRPRNTSAPPMTSRNVRGERGLREARLLRIHQFLSALDRPRPPRSVSQTFFVLQAQIEQQIDTGERRGTCAADHQLDLADVLADHLQPIEDSGADDDGRTVLVVVEHRDLHAACAVPARR